MEISPSLMDLVKVAGPVAAIAILGTLAIIFELRKGREQAASLSGQYQKESVSREERMAKAFDAQNDRLFNMAERTIGANTQAFERNTAQLARLDETLCSCPCKASHAEKNQVHA